MVIIRFCLLLIEFLWCVNCCFVMLNFLNLFLIFCILLVLLFVVVLLIEIEGKEFIGFGVFLFVLLMDFFDGFIVCCCSQVINLGKLFDLVVDKILMLVVFILLVGFGFVLVWIVVIVVVCEFVVLVLCSLVVLQNMVFVVGGLGKVKIVSQIVVILLFIVLG